MKIPLIWLKDYIDTTKSAKELAASFTQLGLMLDKPLDESNVLDLEHRMDRSDWLSILGCARDLAAFEDIALKLPKLSNKSCKKISSAESIQIKVESPAVKRFKTRIIKDIKVGPSPKWLQARLTAYGMEPINNIVDITNFVMIEYAQPLHAQDIAKLMDKDITIRQAKEGETLTTLLGTKLKLDPDIFVLTSGGQVTVIGGIVGGKSTGVNSETTSIILDSGSYDSRIVRKGSRKLKVINESVSRNDKFLDPRTIDLAITRATDLILELAGGTCYENDDYYPSPVVPKNMIIRYKRLKALSGMDISVATVKKILKSLEYTIVEETGDSLTLETPYFRTDVEVEDDLISDILRIGNYSNIPVSPLSTPVPRDLTPDIYRFEDQLRDLMVGQGAHEHIASSLTTSDDNPSQVILVNALTSDQNALRMDLMPGLIKVLSTYKKHNHGGTTVFEIGKVFQVGGTHYLEGRVLTAMFDNTVTMRDSLATLLSSLGITNYHISNSNAIYIGEQLIGSLSPTSYTLVTTTLISLVTPYSGIISEFAHVSSLDLSLLVPIGISYTDILEVINSLEGKWVSISCKNVTKMDDNTNNYLITLTWPGDSRDIQANKKKILSTLKTKLKIKSNS